MDIKTLAAAHAMDDVLNNKINNILDKFPVTLYTGDIDKITGSTPYVISVVGDTASYPTSIGGNRFIIIGIGSDSLSESGKLVFGVQLAIGFGSTKIAVRNMSYSPNGGTWSSWKYYS